MAGDKIEPMVSEKSLQTTGSKDSTSTASNQAGVAWRPGVKNQFPLISLACILTILGLCIGIILVLVLSNNQPVDTWCAGRVRVNLPFGYTFKQTWSIPPSVWIAIFVFFAGKAVAMIFGAAAKISWWTRALKGESVRDLSHHWKVSNSVVNAVIHPKRFGWISLASIAFTAFAGLGTILQKATSTKIVYTTYYDIPMTATLANAYPYRFSGADTYLSTYYSDAMRKIVREYSAGTPIELKVENCPLDSQTNCSATFQGIGFQYTCSADQVDHPLYSGFKGTPPKKHGQRYNRNIFDVSFGWGSKQPVVEHIREAHIYSDIALYATWKTEKDCLGKTLSWRACTLSPALVQYPVRMSDGKATLLPATSKPSWQTDPLQSQNLSVDKVIRVLPLSETRTPDISTGMGGNFAIYTTMGGVAKFLEEHFTSSIEVQVVTGWENSPKGYMNSSSEDGISTGPLTTSFALLDPGHAQNQCQDVVMPDPMDLITSELRALMFRTSVAIVQNNITGIERNSYTNAPGKTAPNATITDPHGSYRVAQNAYQTNFTFLGIGIALMLLSITAVLPLFWGFWNLGRPVSLAPLETAKAFNAILQATELEAAQAASSNDAGVLETTNIDKCGIGGSNATDDQLVELLGDVKVQYGEISPQTLGFGVEDRVSRPLRDHVYL